MLKEVLNLFRRKDVVQDLTGQIGRMIELGQWMFQRVGSVFNQTADWESVKDELYTKDQEINTLEQSIRERVVAHLSVDNRVDLGPCLVLMSVVKDAERIGDYCKNIYEVGSFFDHDYTHGEFTRPLKEIREEIDGLFPAVLQAIGGDDKADARNVTSSAQSIGQRCEMLVHQLLGLRGDFPADEAVAYVLLARHYKRVAAHLSNIATSVVSPVPLLDFPGGA
jgi:phosphate uptake regulator